MEACIEKFEVLMAQIGELLERKSLGYFLSGFRDEVKRRLRTYEPKTIIQVTDLA